MTSAQTPSPMAAMRQQHVMNLIEQESGSFPSSSLKSATSENRRRKSNVSVGSVVSELPQYERGAMSASMCCGMKLADFLRTVFCCTSHRSQPEHLLRRRYNHGSEGDIENFQSESATTVKQYRLEAARRKPPSIFHRLCCCFCARRRAVGSRMGGTWISQNQTLSMYLHWMFRINFPLLFLLSCACYFTLILGFTGLLILAGTLDEQCVRINEDAFSRQDRAAAFADAFSLSWTTFATVGYGSTFPALSNQNDNPNDCIFVTLICSFESFIGVLYSGFCGAILFGKVIRMQSHAQVIFSDPIVVRFGAKAIGDISEDKHEEMHLNADETCNREEEHIPCPVLEFRIVNRLFNEVGGEIMDAHLSVVANVDANDADHLTEFERKGSLSLIVSVGSDDGFSVETGSSPFPKHKKSKRPSLLDFFRHPGQTNLFSAPQNNNVLVSKRVFSNMTVDSCEHPFFKRVWLVRHVLNETSPVITPRARRAILSNGGFWPAHLNNYKGVRRSLKFNQILVSLNGVSNVSASDVSAHNIYDHVDLNVGYEFVNLLYRDGDGLKVDTDLVNDVRVQRGLTAEPLTRPY